jgi:hypothetical protein
VPPAKQKMKEGKYLNETKKWTFIYKCT